MGVARRTASAPTADSYTAPEADNDEGLTAEDENATTERSSSVVKRGWGAAQKKIDDTSSKSYADDWTPPKGETLLKFHEDEPFASVGSHWVNEIKEGKRSFNCLEDQCPLCGVGHKARALVYFNVTPININGEAQEPQVVALKAGPMLTEKIKEENEGRGGPLSRHFWVLKRTDKKQGNSTKVDYSLSVVKARDLVDDFEINPDDVVKTFEGLELYDESIINLPSADDLQEVVDEHLSKD
jgi:hypothetical protein